MAPLSQPCGAPDGVRAAGLCPGVPGKRSAAAETLPRLGDPGGRRPDGATHQGLLLSRCPRARQNGGKVRHKRQALQDMARPLKQWLYKHRDNPYPTKTEKILLALGSQMTLVQVIRVHQAPNPSPGKRGRSGHTPCFYRSIPGAWPWGRMELRKARQMLWLLLLNALGGWHEGRVVF